MDDKNLANLSSLTPSHVTCNYQAKINLEKKTELRDNHKSECGK